MLQEDREPDQVELSKEPWDLIFTIDKLAVKNTAHILNLYDQAIRLFEREVHHTHRHHARLYEIS